MTIQEWPARLVAPASQPSPDPCPVPQRMIPPAPRAGARRHPAPVAWAPPGGTSIPGTLAARTLGAVGPPVVLLHGLPSSGRFWGAAYDALADQGRLVVPDLLGFGRSPRPTGGYGPDDHADAVAATMRRLGVTDEPALIVGHSVGALIGLRLAARHPSLVAGVVGFGPPIYRDYAAARRHLAQLGPMARLFGLDTRWAELACKLLCQRRRHLAAALAMRVRPDLPKALAADAVQHSWESFSETLTRVVLTADARAWFESIDVPVQLIVGEDDPVVDIEFLLELTSQYASTGLDIWTGGGHDLPLVQPGRCRAEIARHLEDPRSGLSSAVAPARRAS